MTIDAGKYKILFSIPC